MGRLWVWFPPHLIGTLDEAQDDVTFRYADSWLSSNQKFSLSYSLPLEDRIFHREAANFFGNLLPEGSARETLCRKLRISVDNDFELLRQIGRDCAGALVLTEEENPKEQKPSLEEISRKILVDYLKAGSSGILDLQVEGKLRLSLAGAQDKLPLVYEKDRFYQPRGGHPSTHILKPRPERFPSLPENEWIHAELCRSYGLPTTDSELIRLGDQQALLVKRYDRLQTAGAWTRLHQEDFCQALGISAKRKYQQEGGPDLERSVRLLEDRSSDSLDDIDRLLRWQIFNVLAGNCDAHGKNISLLRDGDGGWRLAPFYDLLSTRVYKGLSDELAMSVGSCFGSGMVHRKHWQELFQSATVSPAHYFDVLNSMVQKFPERQETVFEKFKQLYGSSPVLNSIKRAHGIQLRRIKDGLKK